MSHILAMNTSKRSTSGMPYHLTQILKQVGQHIQIARKRRRMSEMRLAKLALTSRRTIQRLESGAPGVGIGIVISVLYVLQLEKDLLQLANPDRDEIGLFLEQTRLPKRIHDKDDPEYDF